MKVQILTILTNYEVYYQNPLLIKINPFFINFLSLFINFMFILLYLYLFFTITVTPNSYPRLVSGSQI